MQGMKKHRKLDTSVQWSTLISEGRTVSILTAQITDVPIGHLIIPGLMDEQGEFYVGIPQMVDANLVPPNRSMKQLEALYGKAFASHHKLKTPLNSKAINAISLNAFGKVIVALANAGSVTAQTLRDDLVGLSLQQLFSDAFKVKFEEEERQEWLKERWHHRTHFHPHLTKWLKEDADCDSSAVNWGREINLFKVACKLPLTCVNTWNGEQLQVLNHAETSYNSLRLAGLPHEKAMSVVKIQH